MKSTGFRLTCLGIAFLLQLSAGNSASGQIRPTAATWSNRGEEVLIGSQSGLQLYSWPDMTPQKPLDCRLESVLDLCLSADGRKAIAAGGTAGERGELQIMSPDSGSVELFCMPHKDRITQVRWLPGEQQILTASDDGSATLLNAATGEVVRRITLHSRPLLSLELIGDHIAATAGIDGMIRLWQPDNGHQLRTLENHTAAITDLLCPANQPDTDQPRMYSASRDRTIRLWHPTRGRMIRFARMNSIPESLALTADRQRLLAGCNDGRLYVLHADSLQILHTLPSASGPVIRLLIHHSTKPLTTTAPPATPPSPHQSTATPHGPNMMTICTDAEGYQWRILALTTN